MASDAHRVAAIDIGTNSTRLLIADVAGGQVAEIERRSTVTRLGRGVDLTGQLSAEAIEAACEAIADYVALYREAGIDTVEAIATSAVRDATNGAAFVAELRERFALSARVLDGEEEARLTYLGATSERPPAEPTLVIDIGGGSTELIVGAGPEISFHASLQAGVVRHTERHISSDPPTAVELESLAADVRGSIEAAIAGHDTKQEAGAGIAVAGTPTSLAAIEMELMPYDPERVHGHRLFLPSIQRMLSRLASAPLAGRAEIAGLHPDRAPTIVAGVVILVETMRAFGLDGIEVSEHDILYGAAIAAAGGIADNY
ncbi:MAG TPA: Ppx/GppA phosphatase family protein [Solirubrobacterales bacterium]|jgi:exopolyphosphatase/guanosine-5'-triphosphate,3'-diphosphate pyrophosphatase|nr:Ppx/GppA phosphatase family protein [Solirubrobacterales bacterium]